MKKTFYVQLPLLEALQQIAPNSSKNTLRSWVQEGRVLVQGKAVHRMVPVLPGYTIEIVEKRIKRQGPFPILYEDAHIVVIDKPAGLLSVSTNFETQNTAHAMLKKKFFNKKVYVVHRLDQDTSGVMIFALSETAYRSLKEQLAARTMKRIYVALVEGNMTGKGVWDSFLYEDATYKVHVTNQPLHAERAVTHYTALYAKKEYSLVKFELQTGKKNQIRVQAAEAGFPVVGDEKYGAHSADRLFLHAHTLKFIHPITGKQMECISTSFDRVIDRFFGGQPDLKEA